MRYVYKLVWPNITLALLAKRQPRYRMNTVSMRERKIDSEYEAQFIGGNILMYTCTRYMSVSIKW